MQILIDFLGKGMLFLVPPHITVLLEFVSDEVVVVAMLEVEQKPFLFLLAGRQVYDVEDEDLLKQGQG